MRYKFVCLFSDKDKPVVFETDCPSKLAVVMAEALRTKFATVNVFAENPERWVPLMKEAERG